MTANGAVYALLVGIDAYPPPVPWLAGCRNDVTDLSAFLEGRLGERLRLVTLLDREATRQAIVDAMRTHLGQAARGRRGALLVQRTRQRGTGPEGIRGPRADRVGSRPWYASIRGAATPTAS